MYHSFFDGECCGFGAFLHQPFPPSVIDALCDLSKESHMPVYLNIAISCGRRWSTGLCRTMLGNTAALVQLNFLK